MPVLLITDRKSHCYKLKLGRYADEVAIFVNDPNKLLCFADDEKLSLMRYRLQLKVISRDCPKDKHSSYLQPFRR